MLSTLSPFSVIGHRTLIAGLVLLLSVNNAWASSTTIVFSQYKDRLLQIRVIDTSTNSQSTIGSGFFVDKAGTIVTNYHVIAKHIFKPAQYRIEYVMHDGSTQTAKLLNVNIIHDLAVLDGERISTPHLKLDNHDVSKGERIYTLGNPLDLGMTIVESTYNGTTDDTMHERILLSGALNPGMSGGPSITDDGAVVGVNVAATGTNIGFLVPVKYLKLLLDTPTKRDTVDFIEAVREQLLANQNQYIDDLLSKPVPNKKIGDYSVPDKLSSYLNCWGDTDEKNKPYRISTTTCSIKNDIFISQNQSSGEIRYSHHHFIARDMNTHRFHHVLQQYFASPSLGLSGGKQDVSEFNCHTDFVEHEQLRFKAAFCLRAYKKLHGLYDMVLNAVSLNDDKQAIVTSLTLGGVSHDNAVKFGKAYLRSFGWNRP